MVVAKQTQTSAQTTALMDIGISAESTQQGAGAGGNGALPFLM